MPNVLTLGSKVLCGQEAGGNHGGTVKISSTAKLKVNGKSVLLKSGIGPGVAGCKTPTTNSTNPCSSVTVQTGEATKLKAGGFPVMLDTLSGTTTGKPPGDLPATANQTKLTAV